ncbi:9286_t:CDS:2, partial [Funneliformis geosporum]
NKADVGTDTMAAATHKCEGGNYNWYNDSTSTKEMHMITMRNQYASDWSFYNITKIIYFGILPCRTGSPTHSHIELQSTG